MPGRTSGDMKKLSATRAILRRSRARPSDARVASTTPNRVEKHATSSELSAALWIWRDWLASNNCSYQPKEKPVGGNLSEPPPAEDGISTTTTGVRTQSLEGIAGPPMTKPYEMSPKLR